MDTQGESQTSQVTDDGLHGEKSLLQSASTTSPDRGTQWKEVITVMASIFLHKYIQCIAAGETPMYVQGKSQTSQVTDDGLHVKKSFLQSASTHIPRQRNSMERNDQSDGLQERLLD